ncbi:sensor histidine kinase, partial [Ameyamaea chiangmaiensis]
ARPAPRRAPRGVSPLRWWRSRSVSLRFALVYGMVFVVSSLLFLSVVWWGTVGMMERRVQQAVTADAGALSDQWISGGLPTLARTIEERLEQNVDDDAIYLLVDPAGRVIAGNLTAWPRTITRADRWYQLQISRSGSRGVVVIHAFDLPERFRLLVGRDVRGRDILRRLLTDTLLWAWVMLTILAIGGTLLVRGLFRRIIHSITRTTAAIAQGDLGRRMAVTGSGQELDQIAITINDMLDRISRLMDGVREVSNAIAHDLRTPIARARTLLEDASLHARDPDELRAAIDTAVGNLDNITAVFEALLRIAQIEAGARRAAFTPFDLTPRLRDIAELYEAVAEERELTLAVHLSDTLPFYGDAALIQQAVANLLDNAIKFSPPGGTVTLTALLQPGRGGYGPRGRAVVISVRDTGIGMQPDELARASERFYRANTARDTPGSGLGLSLVQAITSLHGGELDLRQAQPGLEARLLLPCAPQGTAAMTQASSSPHAGDR